MSVSRGTWLVRGVLAVLVVGVLAVLVMSVVVEPLGVEPDATRWLRGYSALGVAVAFLLMLRARGQVMPVLDGEAGGRPPKRRSAVAVVLAAIPLVINVPLIGTGLAAGIVPTSAILATMGAAVAVATILVLSIAPVRNAGWWPHRPGLAALPAATAVVALAASAVAVPAADAALVHVVPADQPMAAGTVPDSLGRVAWTRELGKQEGVRHASPIVGGFALETDDGTGVTGVDGATGEDRWTYTRSGAKVSAVFPADDGGLLVVIFGHGRDGRSEEFSWTVLDATTGEHLHGPTRGVPFEDFGEYTAEVGDIVLTSTGSDGHTPRRALDLRGGTELWSCERAECPDFVGTSESAFIFATPTETGGSRFQALEATTGEELWSYQHPRSCDLRPLHRSHVAVQPGDGPDVVIGYCVGSADVVALDAETGEERWIGKRTRTGSVGYAYSAPGVVAVVDDVDGWDADATNVFDAETGERLLLMPRQHLADAKVGNTLLVSGRDPGNVVEVRNLATGETTEPTGFVRVDGEHCVRLTEGLYCALPHEYELVMSVLEDGSMSIRDWSDHGLPPGLHAWNAAQGPEGHLQRLLPVDGAVVLGTMVRGTYDRRVLVGLVP